MGFLRYRSDGTLDPGFNGTGERIVDFGGQERLTAVAIQTDGKIVAVGAAGTKNFAVVRLNSNGAVDSSFGTAGMAFAPLRNSDDFANDVVLQTDGRIVVAGYSADGTYDFAVARFLP